MMFSPPLIEGILLRRYKRFLADVLLPTGEEVTVHCTNTGSMKNVLAPPQRAWISPQPGKNRKLPYTLEILEHEGALIGVHTHRTNRIVEESLRSGLLSSVFPSQRILPEYALSSGSRIDFYLETPEGTPLYIEVKHVSLAYDHHGYFPDSPSLRAQKHVEELIHLRQLGARTVMLFLTQRDDLTFWSPADLIDPQYGKLVRLAKEKGVEFRAFRCTISPEEITLSEEIPCIL